MPFRVSDGRKGRYAKLLAYAMQDLSAGVMLSAVDYEWTCRRAVLALADDSTPSVKNAFSFEKWCGEGLKEAWKSLLPGEHSLVDVFNVWARSNLTAYVIWSDLQWANDRRNRLAHGGTVELRPDVGWACFHVFEKACDVLDAFVKSRGGDIFATISRQSGFARLLDRGSNDGKPESVGDGEIIESGVRFKADYVMSQMPKKILKRGNLRAQDVHMLSSSFMKIVRRT